MFKARILVDYPRAQISELLNRNKFRETVPNFVEPLAKVRKMTLLARLARNGPKCDLPPPPPPGRRLNSFELIYIIIKGAQDIVARRRAMILARPGSQSHTAEQC